MSRPGYKDSIAGGSGADREPGLFEQYGGTENFRRIQTYLTPKPPAALSITLEFLRGVEAAMGTLAAQADLTEQARGEIRREALDAEVARLREEAGQ